jgi:hypothetical protein
MKKYKALNCNKNVIFKNIPHTLQESVDIMKRKWDLSTICGHMMFIIFILGASVTKWSMNLTTSSTLLTWACHAIYS